MKTYRTFGYMLLALLLASSAWAVPVPPSANFTEEGIDLARRTNLIIAPARAHSPLDADLYVPGGYPTIQAAIDAASNGDIIHVAAGSYVENIIVNKSVTIDGAGQASTFIYPAVSDVGEPNPDDGPSFRGSQVIVIQADNVTISNLTVDGDNTSLTSGHVIGGADVDARNGIIENYGAGVWDGTLVTNVTVLNIYLRGIYMSSGGSGFDVNHCTVQNV